MKPDEFIGRVCDLLPAIREPAPQTEQLRRLQDDTVADFQEAGLFRAMQPKRNGGFELDSGIFYQAATEIGAVCGSTGWVFAVIGVHNLNLALFPRQAQEDAWGEDDSVELSTSLAPTGKVERVEGGFRISGRWSFSSGCDFCRWVVLGGIAPTREPTGRPMPAPLLPRSDYAIDDNWHVMGLSGTGGKDIVVRDAFVPDYRTHSYLDAFHLHNPANAVNGGAALSPAIRPRLRLRPFRRRLGSPKALSWGFASSSRAGSMSATSRVFQKIHLRSLGWPKRRPRSTRRMIACCRISRR